MPKKKKTPAELLRELEKNLQERYERWLHIRKEGCTDPYWADGTNLYLVRNHCLYYRSQIAELCKAYGLSYPKSLSSSFAAGSVYGLYGETEKTCNRRNGLFNITEL